MRPIIIDDDKDESAHLKRLYEIRLIALQEVRIQLVHFVDRLPTNREPAPRHRRRRL